MGSNQSKLDLTENVEYLVLGGRVFITKNVGPLVVLNAKGSISESIENESIESLEDSSSWSGRNGSFMTTHSRTKTCAGGLV